MPEACGQEDTALSPEEVSVWGGQGVRTSGLQSWAGDCLPSSLFLSLPSALPGREWTLQAALSRVPGQRAAGQVSPKRAFGKRLESGWG